MISLLFEIYGYWISIYYFFRLLLFLEDISTPLLDLDLLWDIYFLFETLISL